MLNLYLKSLSYSVRLENRLNVINICNKHLFRSICLSPIEYISFNNGIEEVNFDKKVEVLSNIYGIDLNETKIIKELYKRIDNRINRDYEISISKINAEIQNLLSLVSLDFDNNIEFNDSIDLPKILSSYSVKYSEVCNENYLELLIKYIKNYAELFNVNIFITCGLSNLLENEEMNVLNKELLNIGAYIVDFVYSKERETFNILNVDSDFCIF